MPKDNSIKHVLILGSGPIIIGQACEFDYSGTQAALSLREEGIIVTLLNNNPATIMTDPMTAENIYMQPLTTDSVREILEKHPDIDSVLPTMGGQTALNLAIEVSELGIWEEFNIKILGADLAAIEKTENRERFSEFMVDLGISICPSKTANSYLEGKEILDEISI